MLSVLSACLSDIDECSAGTSGCEQICNNNDGSYNCECDMGFVLKSDRLSCIRGNKSLLSL